VSLERYRQAAALAGLVLGLGVVLGLVAGSTAVALWWALVGLA
jgi:hypothetical protein